MLKNKTKLLAYGFSLLAIIMALFSFMPQQAHAIEGPSAAEISDALISRVNNFRNDNDRDDVAESPCVVAAATLWSQQMFTDNAISQPTGVEEGDELFEQACQADGDWDGLSTSVISTGETDIGKIADLILNTASNRTALLSNSNYGGVGVQSDDELYYISVFLVRCDSGCGDFTKAVATPGELDLASNGGSLEEEGSSRPTCESAGGPLGWILCPVVNALDGFFNWVDSRIQELLTIEEDKFRDENLEQTWRNIRNIAYIVLIPVMLVMVIGTALGFNAIDAYTVKRALPRLIAATIFISLSWEITGFLITLSNELGQGVLGLMTAPLDINGGSDGITLQDLFSPSFGGGVVQGSFVGMVGLFLVTSTLSAEIIAVLFSFLAAGGLIILTAFLVLITRQLFILAFMVFAPVAIIAWIFPGNDRLWKLWWGTFSKLLLMFPLITALIGVGRVFAYIVGNADSAGAEGAVLNPIIKLAAYVIPYALIPLTFKFAGGIFGTLTGMVNDRQKGLFDRLRQSRQPRYERMGRQALLKRADISRNLEQAASRGGWMRSRGLGALSRRVGGYNVEAAMSARTEQVAKEINAQIATGKDDDIRGLTAKYAYDQARASNWDGKTDTDFARFRDGKRQYKSLGGAWIDEANVRNGVSRWGNDAFAQQAALSYEMRKVQDEGQAQGLAQNYRHLAHSLGMTDNEAAGAWIGAAFENQNQHLEYKYTDVATGQLKSGGVGLVDEIYHKRGSYPLAQMGSNTIEQLRVAHRNAVSSGDVDTQEKIAQIAETFMHEYSSGGQIGTTGEDVPVTGVAGAAGKRQASTPGAAAVAERVRQLAVDTGVYAEAPTGFFTDPNHAPTPQRREQK